MLKTGELVLLISTPLLTPLINIYYLMLLLLFLYIFFSYDKKRKQGIRGVGELVLKSYIYKNPFWKKNNNNIIFSKYYIIIFYNNRKLFKTMSTTPLIPCFQPKPMN